MIFEDRIRTVVKWISTLELANISMVESIVGILPGETHHRASMRPKMQIPSASHLSLNMNRDCMTH